MSLSAIYTELHRQAARTGDDRSQTLTGGARIAVRVRGGVTVLTIARRKTRVGAAELETFKRDCNVPSDARRIPVEGQGQRVDAAGVGWWYVAFVWRSEEDADELLQR
jgi:hypothetical protein